MKIRSLRDPGVGAASMTLREAAAYGAEQIQQAGIKNPARDAEMLLLHTTGLSRIDLITRPDRILTVSEENLYVEAIARRKLSEPIQYITGEREFYGLRFTVTPDVLIPRPETEHLVEAALERIPVDSPMRIVDVGTGSGAIAVALAHSRPLTKVTALDISPAALKIAESNAAAHNVASRIRFLESDLLEAVQHEQFDIIVSNPPYIADSERDSLNAEVREYEPAKALFAGPTGLEIYQQLIPQAAKALVSGGWLLMEIGAGQDSQLRQLLEGWNEVSFLPDLQGILRVAIAQRP
jgi:release factor glutamine methyltransferase